MKYEPHFYDSVKGVVVGDNNTVSIIFQNGQQNNVPFLAPQRPPYNIVGRNELVENLKKRLFIGDSLALCALNGLPGVGKTALAIELAYDKEVLKHFSDGILWVGLGLQADVLSHLGIWANILGISQNDIANLTNVEDRAKAIRNIIGLRRMLLVIDDAWNIEAALAFKLGGPNCAHLITTRLQVVALRFAGNGSVIVNELDQLNSQLLLYQLAPEIINAEPEKVDELIPALGGLPLSLILIGNYLKLQSYGGQINRLREAFKRLKDGDDYLHLTEPQSPLNRHPSLSKNTPLSLLTVIGISEESLDTLSRQTLRILSVFPSKPNSFSEEAALYVSSTSKEIFYNLIDRGLLENSFGRYTLHQSIVDYAKTKLEDDTSYEKMVIFFVNHVENYKNNYNIIELDVTNIIAALNIAIEKKYYELSLRLSKAFYGFLETRGLYSLADIHLNYAQAIARKLGKKYILSLILLQLGRLFERQGKYPQAEEYLIESLQISRTIQNYDTISSVLHSLGALLEKRGNYNEAKKYLTEGLNVAKETGNDFKISAMLTSLGVVDFKLGYYWQAINHYRKGIVIARELGDNDRVSVLLLNLGTVFLDNIGDYAEAEKNYQEGLNLAREIGNLENVSNLLLGLGITELKRGNIAEAENFSLEGLKIAREIGHQEIISGFLLNLGELSINKGNFELAKSYLIDGINIVRKIGHKEYLCFLLIQLSKLALYQANYSLSKENIFESKKIAEDIGHSLLMNEVVVILGDIYINENEINRAIKVLQKALKQSKEKGYREQIANSLYGLARIAAIQNKFYEAYEKGKESLLIFRKMNHGKSIEVTKWLDNLPINNDEKCP